jgi:hypothetical protein
MRHAPTAAFALAAALAFSATLDHPAAAQLPRAIILTAPASYFDVQYDVSTTSASFEAGTAASWQELVVAGTARSFQSDGTTPAANTRFSLDVTGGADSNALGVCFQTLNQARLAGGSHVFRMEVVLNNSQAIASGNVTVAASNVRRVGCQIDP